MDTLVLIAITAAALGVIALLGWLEGRREYRRQVQHFQAVVASEAHRFAEAIGTDFIPAVEETIRAFQAFGEARSA